MFCPLVCLYEGVRYPETGVTDICEIFFGLWELNLDPLEEEPVLLTHKPSLQPQLLLLLWVILYFSFAHFGYCVVVLCFTFFSKKEFKTLVNRWDGNVKNITKIYLYLASVSNYKNKKILK